MSHVCVDTDNTQHFYYRYVSACKEWNQAHTYERSENANILNYIIFYQYF